MCRGPWFRCGSTGLLLITLHASLAGSGVVGAVSAADGMVDLGSARPVEGEVGEEPAARTGERDRQRARTRRDELHVALDQQSVDRDGAVAREGFARVVPDADLDAAGDHLPVGRPEGDTREGHLERALGVGGRQGFVARGERRSGGEVRAGRQAEGQEGCAKAGHFHGALSPSG
jgi:hypothetical protein